jgi:hypothetical protein
VPLCCVRKYSLCRMKLVREGRSTILRLSLSLALALAPPPSPLVAPLLSPRLTRDANSRIPRPTPFIASTLSRVPAPRILRPVLLFPLGRADRAEVGLVGPGGPANLDTVARGPDEPRKRTRRTCPAIGFRPSKLKIFQAFRLAKLAKEQKDQMLHTNWRFLAATRISSFTFYAIHPLLSTRDCHIF